MTIADHTFEMLSSHKAMKLLFQCKGLASWLLKPEVFKKADMSWENPKLPEKLGGCWVLVRLNVSEDSVFRSGAIIPLQWSQEYEAHDPRLPDGLRDMANAVLNEVKVSGWILRLAVKENTSEILRQLAPGEKDWQSAWLPLYAGLKLAVDGLLPDPTVFATGAWDGGLQPVTGLKEKFSAARDWGGNTFFCPENCEEKEFQRVDLGERLQKLKTEPILAKAAAPYLSRLAKEPDENAKFEVFDAYYALQLDMERRRMFYLEKISPRRVNQSKDDKDLKGVIENFRGGYLAAWVSNGWGMILNDTKTFEPEKVLLLVAGTRFKKDAEKIRAGLKCETEILEFPENFGIDEARKLNERLKFPDEKMSKVIFDLTLGNVPMSLALYDFPECRPLFLYWDKKMRGSILVPSTSKLKAWQKDETLYRKENE